MPSNANLKLVDNLADGNCLYYAYSISLMYYLKSLQGSERERVVNLLFDRLELTDLNRSVLMQLLASEPDEFNLWELRVIQQILGSATRQTATKVIINEIKRHLMRCKNNESDEASNNDSMGTWTGFYFFVHYPFEKKLHLKWFGKVSRDIPNCLDAEIFQVKGIQGRINQFLDAYTPRPPSNEDKEVDAAVLKAVEAFFSQNDYRELQHYERHLNTDRRWSEVEEIWGLHRYLSAPQRIEKVGELEIYNVNLNLNLDILTGTKSAEGNAHIILKNKNRNHWVSLIPPNYLKGRAKESALPSVKEEALKERFKQTISTKVVQNTEVIQELNKNMGAFIDREIDCQVFLNACHDLLGKLIEQQIEPILFDDIFDSIANIVVEALNAEWFQPDLNIERASQAFNIELAQIQRLAGIDPSKRRDVHELCISLQDEFNTSLRLKEVKEKEFFFACEQRIECSKVDERIKQRFRAAVKKVSYLLCKDKEENKKIEHIITAFSHFQSGIYFISDLGFDEDKEVVLYHQIVKEFEQHTFKLMDALKENQNSQQRAYLDFQQACEKSLHQVKSSLYGSKIREVFNRFMNAICSILGLNPYDEKLERLDQARSYKRKFESKVQQTFFLQDSPKPTDSVNPAKHSLQ